MYQARAYPLSVLFQVDMDALGTTATDGATTGQSISIQFKEKTKAHTDENLCKTTPSTDCPQGEGVHTVHGATKGTFTYEPINGHGEHSRLHLLSKFAGNHRNRSLPFFRSEYLAVRSLKHIVLTRIARYGRYLQYV